MFLIAGSLVEGWLKGKSIFTIRDVRRGIGEPDLLGMRREPCGSIAGCMS